MIRRGGSLLYIIVEDIKSGYDLWALVVRYVMYGQARLITCSGISNLNKTMERLKLQSGDYVLLVVDKTEDLLDGGIIEDIEGDSLKIGFNLIFPRHILCRRNILVF